MMSVTSEENLYAKECLECFCHQHDAFAKIYYCDNGIPADKAFIDDVAKKRQTISFCTPCSHFQNEKQEKDILDVQAMTTTILLHAKAR